jgi:hypothetical protein
VEHRDRRSRSDLLRRRQQSVCLHTADWHAYAYPDCDRDRISDFNTHVHAYSNLYAKYNCDANFQSDGYS